MVYVSCKMIMVDDAKEGKKKREERRKRKERKTEKRRWDGKLGLSNRFTGQMR